MKNLFTLLFLLFALSMGFSQDAKIVISGVYDGPLSGGTPKGVELYVRTAIPDLSIYGLGSANNGGGSDGEEFTFPAVAAAADSYLYIASESPNFTTWFGFAPDYTSGSMGINGDDAIELYESGAVIDVFGDINVDGNGEPWEYLDGWAARTNIKTPFTGTFDLADYTFSGPNALDGEDDNATAANPFPSASLPIVLAKFDAKLLGSDVCVNWETASEVNNSHFVLQHSTDGQNYETLSRVEGAGFSNDLKAYEVFDRNVKEGPHFYRLKQVDFDGKFEVFAAKAISVRSGDAIELYPTAIQNEINIKGTADGALIAIYNMNGQVVKQVASNGTAIDVSDLQSGNYVVRVNDQVLQFVKL